MKLIRLTDDRYVFDGGPDIVPAVMDAFKAWWDAWWAEEKEAPTVFVIGGAKIPIEYEDRRTSDLEARVVRLEHALRGWWHVAECIDLHDEDHNCLDAGGSIIGWRDPIG